MKNLSGRLARHRAPIALSVLACLVGAPAASGQETITWLHLENVEENVAIWEEIAADYVAEHPDVNIELQFLENEAFKAKLPTLLQSADAPSIFYTWGGGVLEVQSETGAIRDVTAALDAEDGAWRNAYNQAAVDGLTFDDKVWAVPFKSGVVSFWYNKDMFEEAGVDGNEIQTWGQLLEAVQALKDAGITPIAVGGGDKWPVHFYWSYLAMREAGQDGFAAAKAGENGGFNSEPFIEASEKLAELGALEPFQPGWLGATNPEAQAVWADGRAAMVLSFEDAATPSAQANGSTDGEGLAADNIGRFPFPAIEGAPGLITDDLGGLNGWAITTNAPESTEDFLKFLTNTENTRRQIEVQGYLPVTKGAEDAVTEPTLALAAEQMSKSTWHQNYLDQDLGPNVGRVVNDVSVAVAAGQMSPEQAVQQIQDTMDLEM